MSRIVHSLLVVVAILPMGCKTTKNLYDAKRNSDIRSLTIAQFEDLRPRQIYRERSLNYTLVRSNRASNRDAIAMGVGAGVGAAAGATGLIAPPVGIAISAVSVSGQLVVAAVENRRTEFLNKSISAPDQQRAALEKLTAGLKAMGYSASAVVSLKHHLVRANEPFKIGDSLPELDRRNWNRSFPSAAPGDAVLVVNVLNFGLARAVQNITKAYHIPFAVIGVKMYRTDTHRLVHEATYIGYASKAMPVQGELSAAVANPDSVRAGYAEAIEIATRMIAEDLRPRTAASTAP